MGHNGDLHITVMNIDKITPDELILFIYPMPAIPETDSVHIITPLLVHYANEYNFLSQLHGKMMAIKSHSSSKENTAKTDILYRALRNAEMMYNASSRILSATSSKNAPAGWGMKEGA
jgi:hypothetical protein